MIYRYEKNNQMESKKNVFSMNQFGQNFHLFFWSVILFLDGIEEKAPKHQTKKTKTNKFKHL